LGTPFFYPEIHEFEGKITLEQLEAIRANPYGYIRCLDDEDVEHFTYICKDGFRMNIFDSKVMIKGNRANINR
jgi:hypothetical protein